MMAFRVIRLVLAALGISMLVGGLVLLAIGGPTAIIGIWALLGAVVLLVAVVLERTRYRSEAAERTSEPSGPGGGESGPIEARFELTPERFVDPTTGRSMRVYIDPRTGERRYRAEP